MSIAVESRNLCKKFGTTTVVEDFDVKIAMGEAFTLIGPHHAGKSSILNLLHCSLSPTSGELFILGLNGAEHSSKIKSQIGILTQDFQLDNCFNVLENLTLFAEYQGVSRPEAKLKARELLRLVHLEEHDYKPAMLLDVGKQKRLATARALINDPKVIFLDEPSQHIKEQDQAWVFEVLKYAKGKGITRVMATSHIDIAENYSDRIALLNQGQVIEVDEPRKLIEQTIGHEVVEFKVNSSDIDYYTKKIRNRYAYQILNNRIRLYIPSGKEGRHSLSLIPSDNVILRKSSLDDVFLKLAGYELDVPTEVEVS